MSGSPWNGARQHYDVHGLVSIEIRGPNNLLRRALDRTLAAFRDEGDGGDLAMNLGAFPSDSWEPSGSTVGDRMVYDPSQGQTTVFSKEMGVGLRKSEVQYVISGQPRVGLDPVGLSVPDNGHRVGRLRQAAFETSKLDGRRALLAIAGDPLFNEERVELEAESIIQTLMEPFLFYRLPSKDCSLVHGAALSSDDSGFLIVGLASVGKTSLALQFVKNGFLYYGDDLPIVSRTGDLLANPKPIKLRPQHIVLYPELAASLTRGMTGLERFLFTRRARKHDAAFMKRLPRLSLGDIFEGAKIGVRVPLRTVLFLKRVAGKEFFIDELDRRKLVDDVSADLFLQFPCAPWRRTMYYFCPSVALGKDFMAEEEAHHNRVKDVLEGAFSNVKVVRMNAPMGYPSTDLYQQIRSVVK